MDVAKVLAGEQAEEEEIQQEPETGAETNEDLVPPTTDEEGEKSDGESGETQDYTADEGEEAEKDDPTDDTPDVDDLEGLEPDELKKRLKELEKEKKAFYASTKDYRQKHQDAQKEMLRMKGQLDQITNMITQAQQQQGQQQVQQQQEPTEEQPPLEQQINEMLANVPLDFDDEGNPSVNGAPIATAMQQLVRGYLEQALNPIYQQQQQFAQNYQQTAQQAQRQALAERYQRYLAENPQRQEAAKTFDQARQHLAQEVEHALLSSGADVRQADAFFTQNPDNFYQWLDQAGISERFQEAYPQLDIERVLEFSGVPRRRVDPFKRLDELFSPVMQKEQASSEVDKERIAQSNKAAAKKMAKKPPSFGSAANQKPQGRSKYDIQVTAADLATKSPQELKQLKSLLEQPD